MSNANARKYPHNLAKDAKLPNLFQRAYYNIIRQCLDVLNKPRYAENDKLPSGTTKRLEMNRALRRKYIDVTQNNYRPKKSV